MEFTKYDITWEVKVRKRFFPGLDLWWAVLEAEKSLTDWDTSDINIMRIQVLPKPFRRRGGRGTGDAYSTPSGGGVKNLGEHVNITIEGSRPLFKFK